ncbi:MULTISPECIES: PDDEXK nuclease domain-containing protein [unclassified Arcicella]|uniref:PDDEXK nuclease domain-containing protein n=1 Tax=unclassified Arcicella TaxID=2644986 RepID=UPI0028575D9C|nr:MULTISPECIES: PDDEXK nuclease domain-containing protein [unclassified Arcicella]MDR6561182.1 putative nuclease of restriction endonuclease-like (RecB) superfamily [Arcicella sp. BE51]MDR6811066.1 putative nuclease of restriction endonuclease-like (RecB) superfamily [Arcicella sp. BE140]MDR6822416.1 putative nuclease of restriction endonuclease-like (RecB) superfamily [Arcicella sp. BE139]
MNNGLIYKFVAYKKNMDNRFTDIIQLIKQSQANAIRAVNAELINLYWNIGEYISSKIEQSEWGDSVVTELAKYIQQNEPDLKGFSNKNIWRMKQFYEAYKDFPKLSTLLREISWSHNLAIFSRCKTIEEREFYLKFSKQENYSFRELERQISASLFERIMIGNSKFSTTLSESNHDFSNAFKDSYVFEFLSLPEKHSESDLQDGLVKQMKNFILELGKDFLFIGEEYRLQVGYSDFYIDLLFYHRGLQCLVAFELKTDKFKPEHLGQLNFYLEALDRDVKKQNENPSIGILLCKDKDTEVVEYALSRSLSPTMVSEYKTQLPDKKLLQQKLHELFDSDKEKK